MKRLFTVLAVSILMTVFAPVVRAEAPQPPPDNSSAELQRIKSLAGRWVTTTAMFGGKPQRMYTEYRVTSGGSAVVERIFPGTPQEMLSVYYDDDNGKLAMTHYCIMRNRPNLKLVSSSPDAITMDIAKIDGMKSKNEPAMGGVTIRFKDANHIETTCKGNGKGNAADQPMTMEYTRVR